MIKKFIVILIFLNLETIVYAVEPEILTIAYESSGESLAGQIAVASVIKTRMVERRMSASEVVFEPHQFSCWNGEQRILSEQEINTASAAWNLSSPGEYNHFMSGGIISSRWKHKVVGRHLFYKL